MKPTRCVLFDLDDTLYDESTFVHAGFLSAAEAVSGHVAVSPAEAVEAMSRIERREGRGRVFDRFLADNGLCVSWVPAMLNAYRSSDPAIALYEDAHDLLLRLRQTGIPTGIVTDGYGMAQRAKVRSLGLDSLVDVVIYTDALGPGRGKPDVAGFVTALRMLNRSAEEAVYVGNDVRKDFIGPRRLSMRSVLVSRRILGDPHKLSSDYLADETFTTLAEWNDALMIVGGVARQVVGSGRQMASTRPRPGLDTTT